MTYKEPHSQNPIPLTLLPLPSLIPNNFPQPLIPRPPLHRTGILELRTSIFGSDIDRGPNKIEVGVPMAA